MKKKYYEKACKIILKAKLLIKGYDFHKTLNKIEAYC